VAVSHLFEGRSRSFWNAESAALAAIALGGTITATDARRYRHWGRTCRARVRD
jgi:hypothetical protein